LRELRLDATPRARFMLLSRVRLLSNRQQYPWNETDGATPLPAEVLRRLVRGRYIGDWALAGLLQSASFEQALADRDLVERALRPQAVALSVIHERANRAVNAWLGVLGSLRTRGKGRPKRPAYFGNEDSALIPNQLYWRKRTPWPGDYDPDRDRCGLLWW